MRLHHASLLSKPPLHACACPCTMPRWCGSLSCMLCARLHNASLVRGHAVAHCPWLPAAMSREWDDCLGHMESVEG
jgi:hypothetical protein